MGKTKKETEETRRQKQKECMRRLREKIKSDPILYEAHKMKIKEYYKNRKDRGKIKMIAELSEREQRSRRKAWREQQKKSYNKKKEEKKAAVRTTIRETANDLPLPEGVNLLERPAPAAPITPISGNSGKMKIQGELLRRKHRKKLNKEISSLKEKIRLLEKSNRKYKKRVNRLKLKEKKANPDTPNKKVDQMLVGQKVTPEVRRNLVFGECLKSQINENFSEKVSNHKKKEYINVLRGKITKKYKVGSILSEVCSRRLIYKKSPKEKEKIKRFCKIIEDFFERDDVSRMCPGKRDTVTYKKTKKQKRYLNDTLLNLHKKFLVSKPNIRISYAHFCRFRPFWVLPPRVDKRETCLCKQHSNMELLISKLKFEKIIQAGNPTDLIKEVCCENYSNNCLERVCEFCRGKEININLTNPNEEIEYEAWQMKKEHFFIKGVQKVSQRTVKDKIKVNRAQAVQELLKKFPKFLLHTRNIIHQYQATDQVKKNLSFDEVLIHIDFSENYTCKYASEIQSAHFGGSKPQVSLHTVVIYYWNMETLKLENFNMCTMSENLRHDPAAICAHLGPVIKEIKEKVPQLKQAHFLSDGPSTQYKNKTMFFLMVRYLTKKLGVESLRWHYSESGHGKGAPDGIGGQVKAAADRMVAHGVDIPNFTTLAQRLHEGGTIKKIKCVPIMGNKIDEIDALVKPNIKTFKGSLAVRELVWTKQHSNDLEARKLSCLKCATNCFHFSLGFINYDDLCENKENQYIQTPKSTHHLKKFRLSSSDSDSTGLSPKNLNYSDIYSNSDDDIPLAKLSNFKQREKYVIKESDYVVVKLQGKKCAQHFVAFILSVKNHNITVKFLKNSGKNKYIFPDKDDISEIDFDDIIAVLGEPELNTRQQYVFKDLPQVNIL